MSCQHPNCCGIACFCVQASFPHHAPNLSNSQARQPREEDLISRQSEPTEQDAHEQSIREASEALIAAHRRASQAGSIPADQQGRNAP